MNDQEFFDLAIKVIGRRSSDAERAELESLFASRPELKAEFEEIQADARLAREVLPLLSAVESSSGEFPAYARERLQRKVRETLRRREPARARWGLNWRWMLGLAAGAAVVVVFLLPMLTRPAAPVIQIAMLDTIGAVRGSDTNEVEILKQQWKNSDVQGFNSSALLGNWQTNWPEGDKMSAKVIYDRAAGEVRVLLRGVGKPRQRTFVIEHDLVTALQEADAFIREQTKK